MEMDKCLLTLGFALLVLAGCSARVVTVSPGPLIRVEGQPVSISCDVNDYSGPREQDFEWVVSKSAVLDDTAIKIISTFDSSYSDKSLTQRVASGDISVVRLADNQVELKIAEVKSLDAGFYWCQTPSTDSVISGNYEARVQVTVIPNTLKVSSQTPTPKVPEGNDLTLSCNVTRTLTNPTYLSVSWSVKSGAASEEILTFGPQGDVSPGAKFVRHYADGGIRLVPGKNGLFELVITRVTTSDSGTYTCSGAEWTNENEGRWVKIVESTKEMGTVGVIPTEKCNHNVEEGGTIEVPLDYSMQNIHKLEWMYNDVKIYNGPNDKDGKRKTTLDNKQRQGKVYENGSLKMEKLMKSHEGTYKANYYDNKGKLIGSKVAKLCVFDLVPKPTVKIDCSSSPAKFTCSAKQIEKFNIEWLKNKDVLKNEKKATLTQKAEPVKNGELTCRIYNEAKSMTSEPVTLNCNKAGGYQSGYTFPEKIWGINSWIIVGCGAGIVVLLIVMVVACFIRAKVKNRMRQKDEEELRLDWANLEQQQYQHPQQQQQQQQHCQPPGRQPHQQRQPQQAGHTGPRQHRSKQHREQRLRAPESDNANPQPSPRRAAQVQAHRPAVNDDEEQPPPLPQPRKTARTPRV